MTAQTILPANSVRGGDLVTNSLRFNTGSSDHLTRTNGGAGNRRRFTYSFWVKRSTLGTDQRVIEASTDNTGNEIDALEFTSDDIRIVHYHASGNSFSLVTDQKFRDPSAWMNIVVAFDTAQGTAANRVKLYVNGTRVTSFSTEDYPGQNYDNYFNNNNDEVYIGRRIDNGGSPSGEYFGGYLSEFVLIDGLALGPTSFGEFDEDSPTLWKPIDVSDLTFGTNGFYLQFKQAGTGTNISGMGADTSGNTNHFAVVNLTAVDQTTDTCQNNFATFNSLTPSRQSGGVVAYTEGNTKIVTAHSNANYLRYPQAYTTLGVTSGKWYAEFKIGAIGSAAVGIANTGEFGSDGTTNPYAGAANSGAVYTNGGEYRAGAFSDAGSQGTYTEDDIIGCALDLDNLAIYWHKNGTYINSGDPTSGSSKTGARAVQNPTTPGGFYVFTAGADNSGNATIEANFGSPSYANSSSATDGRVHGDFEYAPPSGFFALCSKNLGEFG